MNGDGDVHMYVCSGYIFESLNDSASTQELPSRIYFQGCLKGVPRFPSTVSLYTFPPKAMLNDHTIINYSRNGSNFPGLDNLIYMATQNILQGTLVPTQNFECHDHQHF